MKKSWFVTLLLLAASGIAHADGINLVQNPNFNTSPGGPTSTPGAPSSGLANTAGGSYAYDVNNASPWDFTTGSGIAVNGSAWGWATPPNGAGQNAFLQAFQGNYQGSYLSWPTSSISQDVTGLAVGAPYELEFYLADRNSYSDTPVDIYVGGVEVGSILPAGMNWTLYSLTFVATSSSEDLAFSIDPGLGEGATGDYDAGLADVQIYLSPEPGSLLLLGSGLLILAFGISWKARRAGTAASTLRAA